MNWLVVERGNIISPRLSLLIQKLGILDYEYVCFNFRKRKVINGLEYRPRSVRLRSLFAIYELFLFAIWVKKLQKRSKYEAVLAGHYTIYLPLILVGVKNVTCDSNDLVSTNSFLIFRLWMFFESLITMKSEIILASRYFERFYLSKHIRVIENVCISDKRLTRLDVQFQRRIAFVGALRHVSILKNLIYATSEAGWHLDFYGSGNVDETLKKYVEEGNYENVTFHGRFIKSEIPKIYSEINMLWAVYPSDNWNVKYAISNKYHESMLFKVPCVFASNTLLGKHVSENKIGFTIGDCNKQTIVDFLLQLNQEGYIETRSNINYYQDSYGI